MAEHGLCLIVTLNNNDCETSAKAVACVSRNSSYGAKEGLRLGACILLASASRSGWN